MTKRFVEYSVYALSNAFPTDKSTKAFVGEIHRQLLAENAATLVD